MSAPPEKKIRNLEDFAGIASDWFWETDSAHRFTYFSSKMEEVTGMIARDLIGKRRDSIPKDKCDDPNWLQHLDDLAHHRPFRCFEYVTARATTGKPLWVRVAGQPLFDRTGAFIGYRGTGHDMTVEKEALRRLETANAALQERNRELDEARSAIELAAFEDSLTGILNRWAFERDVTAATSVDGAIVALLHVDLDRFKWVNDTWGHPAGDEILKQTAQRLRQVVAQNGSVYRIGGDEFMIILRDGTSSEQANWIGDSLVDAINQQVHVGNQRVTTCASVGLALSTTGPSDAADLIRQADLALYEAKRSGRGTSCQVTAEMQHRMNDHRRLCADLPGALERREFIPYFQLQVNAEANCVIGAEALARWQHPVRGLLSPATFLDGAATLGLVGQIDKMIFEDTMSAVARLAAAGIVLPSISVNVSEARLLDPHFPDDIARLWTERRCQLCVELLETIYFDDKPDDLLFAATLQRLRDLGVALETDDFGSGRASITGLIKIRPNRLKIDRSLVQAAIDDPHKRSIMSAIVDMARALKIECLAEGVETTADIAAICALGCTAFQGYAISHPLSEADLAAFLASRNLMQFTPP